MFSIQYHSSVFLNDLSLHFLLLTDAKPKKAKFQLNQKPSSKPIQFSIYHKFYCMLSFLMWIVATELCNKYI